MTTGTPITGTILGILHHGSAVALSLGVDEGEVLPVYFDAKPFAWLLAGEQCHERDLLGRKIAYDGEHVMFVDEQNGLAANGN